MFTLNYTMNGRKYTSTITNVDKAIHLALVLRRQGAEKLSVSRTAENYGPTRDECRQIAARRRA